MNLRKEGKSDMELTVTYLQGNDIATVRGTPAGDLGDYFVLRKTDGGIIRISKRFVIKVEEA